MQQITGLTSQPFQQTIVTLQTANGTTKMTLQLYFRQSQSGWFFASINWNNGQFVENGRRIVNHGNMLRQYKNVIPFGVACFTVGNREPTQVQDFSSGQSNLYLLSAQEVASFESFVGAHK